MAFNKNRNFRFDTSGGNGNYGKAPYQSNGGQRQSKKHSGAKFHPTTKNGEPCITAWNYSRRNGMRKFIIAPTKNTSDHSSSSGRVWQNWMIKMTLPDGTTHLSSGLFDTTTRKVSSSDLGMVFNPNAPNGGYAGKFGGRR